MESMLESEKGTYMLVVFCDLLFFQKTDFSKLKKVQKKIGLAEFGGFDAGNELLRRFGGHPSKNRRNRCLGGDFLGQNKIFKIFDFFKKPPTY